MGGSRTPEIRFIKLESWSEPQRLKNNATVCFFAYKSYINCADAFACISRVRQG
jgi:hypothetical protein